MNYSTRDGVCSSFFTALRVYRYRIDFDVYVPHTARPCTQAGVSKRHGLGYDVRSSQAQRTPNKGSAVPRPLPAPRDSRARGAHVVHLDHPRHGGTPLEEGVHVLRRDEDELPAGLRLADLEQRVDLGWGWG